MITLPTTAWHARTHRLDAMEPGTLKTLRSEVAQQGFTAFKVGDKEYRASVDEAGKIKVQRNWEGSSLLARLFKPLQGHCSRELTKQLDGMDATERKSFVHERRECSAVYANNFAALCDEIKSRVSNPSLDKSGFFRVPGATATIEELKHKMGTTPVDGFAEYDTNELIGVLKASKGTADLASLRDCIRESQSIDGKEAVRMYREQVLDAIENSNQKSCRELAVSTIASCYNAAPDDTKADFNKSNFFIGTPLVCSMSLDKNEANLSALVNGAILSNWADGAVAVEGKTRIPPLVPPKPKAKSAPSAELHNAGMDKVLSQLREKLEQTLARM